MKNGSQHKEASEARERKEEEGAMKWNMSIYNPMHPIACVDLLEEN